ncbi:MAG: KipI antagonist, partial [Bacteroidota bacterium]|nr:KipI antagonist [Bacteroidota bacterium]
MSIRIIKPGILDTIQDLGRYGYQHLGINPGGVMDHFATQVVNGLVANEINDAVIEMHFPAATILFQQEALIAIGGADFIPSINGEKIQLWQPVMINKNCLLHFHPSSQGARCYLALKDGFTLNKWLTSYSTNVKAGAGGFNGRALHKDDVIYLRNQNDYRKFLGDKDFIVLPWKADIDWDNNFNKEIKVLPGNEWDYFTNDAKNIFINQPFTITASSDR